MSASVPTVAVIVGSLRKASINRTFAGALGALAEGRLAFESVRIDDLPLYNEDLWADPPEAVARFKAQVRAADAVLFVTPEYNRGYTPAIKNVIDWGTRPRGESCWIGKPAAIVGTSPGGIGTAVAQAGLRTVVTACDMALMGAPEMYFSWKPELFDAEGRVANPDTKAFLDKWVDRYAAWISRLKA